MGVYGDIGTLYLAILEVLSTYLLLVYAKYFWFKV